MKPAWREADRAAELLAAARGWREAGLIDETTLKSIATAHLSAGPRLGPLWRVLVFGCVAIGASTIVMIITRSLQLNTGLSAGLTLLLCGLALAAVTESVIARCSFRATGAEAATSLLAVSYLCAAALALLGGLYPGESQMLRVAFPWCATVLALAAWRWGFRLYAGAAAVCLLLFEESYLFAGASRQHPGDLGLLLAGIGSALYPLAILVWGLRARDRALIGTGLIAGALSLTTIRFYVHVAPLWTVLAVSGAALASASLLLERWLKAGGGGERFGFTAAALHEEERRGQLLPVAAAIAMAPEARVVPEESPGITGKGGGFGGGGTGGTF